MLRAYKTFGCNLIESRAHTTGSAKAVTQLSLMSTQFVVKCIQGFASCYQEVPCIWRRSIEDVHRRCNYWDCIQIMSRLIGCAFADALEFAAPAAAVAAAAAAAARQQLQDARRVRLASSTLWWLGGAR